MNAIIDGKMITNMEQLMEYIEEKQLNVYHGYDENSSSFVYSFKDHRNSVKIIYDDLYDCKRTEIALKKVCPVFYPRKFAKKRRSIGIGTETMAELDELREGTESYDMIVWKLLLEHHCSP